jgi:hypothetical protein
MSIFHEITPFYKKEEDNEKSKMENNQLFLVAFREPFCGHGYQ